MIFFQIHAYFKIFITFFQITEYLYELRITISIREHFCKFLSIISTRRTFFKLWAVGKKKGKIAQIESSCWMPEGLK